MTASKSHEMDLIRPDWEVPSQVAAVVTTRSGGVSEGDFASLNLADYVGDAATAVQENRWLLQRALKLRNSPVWLAQEHGSKLVCADDASADVPIAADAAWTATPHAVCAILSADCLPVLFCDRAGTRIAAVHAGWRGLCAGVLENTLENFVQAGITPADIMIWMGPAIGPDVYEVDAPVRDAFLKRDAEFSKVFKPAGPGHWHLNIYSVARRILSALGVESISGGAYCTYTDPRFFSYRRAATCGRQAALIWLTN